MGGFNRYNHTQCIFPLTLCITLGQTILRILMKYTLPSKLNTLDISWVILMIITSFNALVAETAEPDLVITAIICFSIAYKGRRIMDYFMELNHANATIQKLMRSYFYVFPALIFLTDLFSEELAVLTAL